MADLYRFPSIEGLRHGGEPPDNGDMEARVAKLESASQQVLLDLAAMRSDSKHYATKEDLHRELHASSWRIIGAMLTFGTFLVAVTYYIARNVH